MKTVLTNTLLALVLCLPSPWLHAQQEPADPDEAIKVGQPDTLIEPMPGRMPRVMPPFDPDIMPRIPAPRIQVSTPDVGPMQTRELSVTARVDGLYAVVETTMLFHNPNARELEGELVFPLPDGAAVCGYALDINGVLVDGVVVTKERARVAFETETRTQVDPGLVEHVQGNLYRTRIYPLPANGERRIRVTYTTPLATAPNGDAALLLPMPREEVAKLDVTIEVAAMEAVAPEVGGLGDAAFQAADQVWRVQSTREDVTPGEDILVALPKLPESFYRVEIDEDGVRWFMISAMVPETEAKAFEPGRIHVLWDASGNRAEADIAKELELLRNTKATGYLLTVFRDIPEESREFATVEQLIKAIEAAPIDGGSDFTALAASLRDLPAAGPNDLTLLFTDGIDTLSGQPIEFENVTPVPVVSQMIANREALRQASAGLLIDLQILDAEAAWAEIASPADRVTGIEGTGVAQVQGIGQPAQGRVSLLGRLTDSEAAVRIVYADGTMSEGFLLMCEDALEDRVLSTAWASARVNQLSPRAEEFEEELLELGRTYGLVSPATSLIVLETLDQWVRHEIEPPAMLADMRRQWNEAMKRRGGRDTADPARHLERVVALWEQRVAWWQTDFSKAVPAPQPPAEGRLTGVRGPVEPDMLAEAAEPRVMRAQPADDVDAFFAPPAPPAPAAPAAEAASSGEVGDRLRSAPASRAGGGQMLFGNDGGGGVGESGRSADATIEIKAWNPDTPYLNAIRAAEGWERYAAYLEERANWAQSPAFFLDAAEVFYADGDDMLGRRVLSNLAELRIEDPALLRVFAWRLQQAGDLDTAAIILRRVARLRAEEPQSFRDLALVLAERGRATASKDDIEEALELFLKVALGNWNRHGDSIALFALEEMNALIAWAERKPWSADQQPSIPEFDERLAANLDTDLRIVMSWNADATDIDLHVIEPGGEEAFYGHNRTARGGLVSDDITDGYGPEEYLIRIAPQGEYKVRARYFGSRQQTVVGPATVTATVFTNWGRPNEERQVITVRLDKPEQMVEMGAITFGRGELKTEVSNLRPGMSRDQVLAILGEPDNADVNPLEYTDGAKTFGVFFDDDGRMVRAIEILPGGGETIVVQ